MRPEMSPEAIVEEYRAFLRDAVARLCPRDMGLQFDVVVREASLLCGASLRGSAPTTI